jgi:nuclear transport factor 2 (NTF2) superfamily protein
MIPCICINSKNKPQEIPENKWLKEGWEYHVIYTVIVLPQKQLAFHLAEIDLDESSNPYTYFLAHRFAFTEEGIKQLMELIKDCTENDINISELIEQTKLQEV